MFGHMCKLFTESHSLLCQQQALLPFSLYRCILDRTKEGGQGSPPMLRETTDDSRQCDKNDKSTEVTLAFSGVPRDTSWRSKHPKWSLEERKELSL